MFRMRLYDWWSAAVGMRVGAGSWVLFDTAICNLEDAHLVKVRYSLFDTALCNLEDAHLVKVRYSLTGFTRGQSVTRLEADCDHTAVAGSTLRLLINSMYV